MWNDQAYLSFYPNLAPSGIPETANRVVIPNLWKDYDATIKYTTTEDLANYALKTDIPEGGGGNYLEFQVEGNGGVGYTRFSHPASGPTTATPVLAIQGYGSDGQSTHTYIGDGTIEVYENEDYNKTIPLNLKAVRLDFGNATVTKDDYPLTIKATGFDNVLKAEMWFGNVLTIGPAEHYDIAFKWNDTPFLTFATNTVESNYDSTNRVVIPNLWKDYNATDKYMTTQDLANQSMTVTHLCPIDPQHTIDDFIVGAPVYMTGKVFNHVGKEWVPSTRDNSIDCISSVKTRGTWKEYLGICTSKTDKEIRFASHGDFLVKVSDSSTYGIGDSVYIEETEDLNNPGKLIPVLKILSENIPLTAKIMRMTVGIVTSIIDTKTISVFRE